MVYGFLQFSQWFLAAYPDYFISPLRITVSAIESIFSVLKFTAGGNLSLQATLDLFVEDSLLAVRCQDHLHQVAGAQGHHTLHNWFMTLLV